VEETQAIQQLAKAGYLGDKKDYYLSAKTLTDEDVTNALIAIDANLLKIDLKSVIPDDKRYQLEDLKTILGMVKDRADELRAQKVSVWIFQHRLQKMVEAVNPASAATPVSTLAASKSDRIPVISATPTETPVLGPNRAEWNDMKDTIKDLTKKVGDLQDKYEKKLGEIEISDQEIKTSHGEFQEQLKLIQKILDHVQNDQKKLEDRLEEVAKKAGEKNVTDTELKQDLLIMHKDLRDNKEDVSILKQEVEKLNAPAKSHGTPLDDLLGSKWVAGGALLVGVTALVIALTKK
jgi:hypothetical protein